MWCANNAAAHATKFSSAKNTAITCERSMAPCEWSALIEKSVSPSSARVVGTNVMQSQMVEDFVSTDMLEPELKFQLVI